MAGFSINLYDYLGVPRNAAADEIKRAYLRKSYAAIQEGKSKQEQENLLKAYTILSDPKFRSIYDATLDGQSNAKSTASNNNNSFGRRGFNNRGKRKTGIGISSYGIAALVGMFIILGGIILALINRDEPKAKVYQENLPEVYVVDEFPTSNEHDFSNSSNIQHDGYLPKVEVVQPEKDYEVKKLKTGATPYRSYFGKGVFDKKSPGEFKIINGSQLDAVVLLLNQKSKVIRHCFIKSGQDYQMHNIPEMYGYIKVMMGHDWNPTKDNGPSNPKGGFMKDISYSKSGQNEPFDFHLIFRGNDIKYPSHYVTLHKVANGNLESTDINKDNFFEN